MIVVQSFQFKGIAVSINVDSLREVGIISYLNKTQTVKSTDIVYLNKFAKSLVNKELNGIIRYMRA